jgi:hypothetical protein
MAKWNCEICNVDVDKSQKARHLKTKKHQNNLNPHETIADILPIDAIEETTKKRKKKRAQNKKIKKKDKHYCQVCNETIKKSNIKNHLNSKKHEKRCNENCEINTENGLQIELKKSSFNTTFISFIIKNTVFKDIDEFLNVCDNLIKNKIEFYVKKHKGIRVNICLNLKLKHIITNEIIDYNVWSEKNNEGRVILLADDHKKKVDKMINSIRSLALSRNPADTKFRLNKITSVQLNISKYRPLKGGKYKAFPTEILRKQAVSLIDNCNDNNCFNLTIKKYFQNLNIEKIMNFDGIPEPTPLTEKYFKLFKKQNPDISINIISFDYSEEMVVDDIIVKEASLFLYPCYISKHIKQYDIDILFLPPDNNTEIGHYSLINDLSKLVRSQITNHKERIFLCKNCFRDQKSQEQLNIHIKDCYKNEESCIRMPTENIDNIIEFKNYYNSLKQPIQIIFDFESILEKENKLKGKSIIIQL